jgi:tetratricopeptide (TPR) repeat protein
VYSLGVVLYRILTGRSPYPENTRTPLEFAKVICEAEPTRPSSRLVRSTKDANSAPGSAVKISDHSVDKSRRQMKGDLDHIVLKALRKEPGRRYASVEQFSDDIRRHLEGLPVLAVKGSARYRVGKFIRRNRVALAASALVVITLVAGITATIRQARIARRQAEIANAERARAEQRFKDVRELANSLIFEIHDSIQALPGATPSRKLLLDRAVQYLDKLSQDAAGDSNLERELAWAYQRLATVQGDTTQSNLGEVGAARVSNGKAVALFEAVAKANPNHLTDQINLAMAYRMRTLFDVFEPSGRAEIEKALAVTEPLMQTNKRNLDLKNESAQEYYILAAIEDIAGDRLPSIASFRKALAFRLEILSANPTYPGIRQGAAKTTVLLAHEVGRFASKEEGLGLMNTGIADFQALQRDSGGDPGIVREVSAAATRRGDIELMKGDVSAARADFQSAQHLIERLAKLDPENKMLQSDIWVAEFEEGRAVAVAGRYAEALPLLQHAFEGYKSLRLEADVGPGPAAMQAWIGEAQAGMHHYARALESYKAAAAGLAEDAPHYDDARCDLAMVETKIGHTLLEMGKPREAEAHYEKALAIANVPVSLEHGDFPALYAAAEAYAGAGDVSAYEARTTQSKSWSDACASYENSLSIWKRIPSPSRFGPNGYLSLDSQEVAQRLTASKAELARRAPVSNADHGKG